MLIYFGTLILNKYACFPHFSPYLVFLKKQAIAKAEEELLVTEINWRKITDVESLAEYAINPDLGFQLAAVRQARRLLACKKVPPYDQFIESGIIPSLVKFMDSKNTTLQFDSTWILAHIASGTIEQTAAIVEADSIPSFINLLNSPNKEIKSQALWGLSHIIDKSPKSRNECINAGIISAFAKLADSEATNLADLRNIAWSLKNLCKQEIGNNLVKIEILLDNGILGYMLSLIRSQNKQIKHSVLYILGKIMSDKHQENEQIFDVKLIHEIVKLLKYNDYQIRIDAAKIIVSISMQPKYIKTLIKHNVISRLCKILRHPLKNDDDLVVILTDFKNIVENSNKNEKKMILKEMKNSGGTSLFSKFERHENERIKNICKEIIDFIDNHKIIE
uniref:Uncharacterized protein n=1 Tax=Panagrolaimus davidi TaxID=227884 RepID=A0A914P7D6_9BILA